MAADAHDIGFIGDLDDPWVAAIADALSTDVVVERAKCAGDIPDEPFGRRALPRLIVLHRHRLSAADRTRLKRWREPAETEPKTDTGSDIKVRPAVILCVSPYVRYEETERVFGLVDQVVPEGTAADILPGRVGRFIDGGQAASTSGSRRHEESFTIEVSGKNQDLCKTVVEICTRAGYRAAAIDDLLAGENARVRSATSPVEERALTIWEVPVLELGWPDALERRAVATGPLIGLLGFADRATVSEAKQKGAIACLDLPFEVQDLLDSVDRAARSRSPEHWPLPARAEPPHHLPPRPRRRAPAREPSSVPRPWRE
jgi:hypothetical protein